MHLKSIIVAGSLVLATSAYAQNYGHPPYYGPGSTQPETTQPGVAQPRLTQRAPGVHMRSRPSGMPRGTGTNTFQGGPNNSTGNMNNRGAGFGTTGTGGPGGSGNR